MLNYHKAIEILISVQVLIFSTMLPVFVSLPGREKIAPLIALPITWQVPAIIIITLIFKREVVLIAFTLYLIIGLLFLPVFQDGGSLGYLLTPNFGYLLGMYPLIHIIGNLLKKNRKLSYLEYIKSGILGIYFMHLVGIIYSIIQYLYYREIDLLLYNISIYSIGKFAYHICMLLPTLLIIKNINNYHKELKK